LRQEFQGLLNDYLSLGIDVSGSFIENQNPGSDQDSAGKTDELPLSLTQVATTFPAG